MIASVEVTVHTKLGATRSSTTSSFNLTMSRWALGVGPLLRHGLVCMTVGHCIYRSEILVDWRKDYFYKMNIFQNIKKDKNKRAFKTGKHFCFSVDGKHSENEELNFTVAHKGQNFKLKNEQTCRN